MATEKLWAMIEDGVKDDGRDRRRRRDGNDRDDRDRRRRDDGDDRDRRRRDDRDDDRDRRRRDHEDDRDRDRDRRRRDDGDRHRDERRDDRSRHDRRPDRRGDDDRRDRERRDGGRDSRRGDDRDRRRDDGKRRDDRDRNRDRDRDNSLSRLRSETAPPPPPAAGQQELGAAEKMARAIERDRRTVFVSHLHPKVDDFEVFEFFSRAGKVRDVRLITDKNGKSKGCGYVEFYDPSSVAGALAMQGMEIRGHPCMVKLSESEKNLHAAIAAQQVAAQQQSSTRLRVSEIDPSLGQDDIRQLFAQLGPLESVELHKQSPTSWAHVKYRTQEDAKKAVAHLGNQMLGSHMLKVGLVGDLGSDAEPGEDAALNARAAQLLLQRLGGQPPLPPTPPPTGEVPPPPAMDTTCVRLSNLFNPQEEEEDDFDEDIKEEVSDQCNKLGRLVHVFVDKNSPSGEVWLRFKESEGGRLTREKMHDRWFAKRQIHAEFIPAEVYTRRFPESAEGC
eukprot:TRINITY_DN6692_c0_g1_i1.p1 TRINITY_DN6692_c0_g1~~TRINITY_DN6692_c0_g1_i1.p1  ORF type:complete len:537 (+),score=89.87 TRINITY_DN6692_c0_g1_i1:103-1611(+)